MDTLEDLAKFVEGRLVEIEARYLKLSDDDEDIDLAPTSSSGPQEISGTLSKWTNYIHGWQDRYIVVKEGVMAYYKSQHDTENGCRGSFITSQASVKVVSHTISTIC